MLEIQVLNEFEKANEFNNFYNHFELTGNGSIDECRDLLSSVICDYTKDRIMVIDLSAVAKIFKRPHVKKSSGPDGISAFLLKTFADELSPAWSPLFQ